MKNEHLMPESYEFRLALADKEVEIVESIDPLVCKTIICKQGQRILTQKGKDLMVVSN